jgi:hypothetical protein
VDQFAFGNAPWGYVLCTASSAKNNRIAGLFHGTQTARKGKKKKAPKKTAPTNWPGLFSV